MQSLEETLPEEVEEASHLHHRNLKLNSPNPDTESFSFPFFRRILGAQPR